MDCFALLMLIFALAVVWGKEKAKRIHNNLDLIYGDIYDAESFKKMRKLSHEIIYDVNY
jgi:hypothetical protein